MRDQDRWTPPSKPVGYYGGLGMSLPRVPTGGSNPGARGWSPPSKPVGYYGGLGMSLPSGARFGQDGGGSFPVPAKNTGGLGLRTQTPAYARPEVRSAVDKLMADRPTRATDAAGAGQYGAELSQIQKLIDAQSRAAQAEKDAQLALAQRERKSAYDRVGKEWERYGLDGKEIRKALKGLAETDYLDGNAMVERVRQTQSWANRYGAVTKGRASKGLSYITEGEILNLEDGYREVMSAAGMPKGFYNSHKDFQNWIANDVSVREIGERVEIAEAAIANTDPDFVKAFKQYYGIKKGDLAAYMLDRKRGTEVLGQQVKAAEIGAEALETGIKVGTKFAEELVDKDVSRQQARQAFDAAAQTKGDWNRLAAVSQETLTERSLVEDELGLDPKTGIKKKRLASQERSRWGGSSGSGSAFGGSRSGSF